jgi:hypothetical protein
MIPEAAPSTQISGSTRACPPFKYYPLFLRNLQLIQDKNLVICLPLGDVYPLNFSVSSGLGNLFQLGFILAIPSPSKSPRVHLSLNACKSTANWSSTVEESPVWRRHWRYETMCRSTSIQIWLVFSFEWRRSVILNLSSWMFVFCVWISHESLDFGFGIDAYVVGKVESPIGFIWIRGIFHQSGLSGRAPLNDGWLHWIRIARALQSPRLTSLWRWATSMLS